MSSFFKKGEATSRKLDNLIHPYSGAGEEPVRAAVGIEMTVLEEEMG